MVRPHTYFAIIISVSLRTHSHSHSHSCTLLLKIFYDDKILENEIFYHLVIDFSTLWTIITLLDRPGNMMKLQIVASSSTFAAVNWSIHYRRNEWYNRGFKSTIYCWMILLSRYLTRKLLSKSPICMFVNEWILSFKHVLVRLQFLSYEDK